MKTLVRFWLALSLLLCGALSAVAQSDETFVINLRNAEIATLAEQVSEITGRTLVLDPNIAGDVTVVSTEALDQEGVWALFQSILRVRGFVAVQSGTNWQIVPETEARTISGPDLATDAGSQDFVTEMLRLTRLPSAEAVRVLRPLVAESGYIEAIADPNAIIITDTRANVDRIKLIAQAFDGDAAVRAEVIRFRFADAGTVGNAILEVLGPAGTGVRLSVDPGANLLLVRGTPSDIQDIRELADAMDVAPRNNPQAAVATTVFRLQFGDAEVIAEIIRNTVGDAIDITNPVAQDAALLAEGGEVAADPAGSFVALDRVAPPNAIAIQASSETNSIIVRGTAAQVQEVGQLIGALDVRRPQVMIEAAIVEVSGEVGERLGVQLGLGGAAVPGSLAATSFGNGGISLQGVLSAIGGASGIPLSTGLSIGVGNNDFSILIQALSQSSQARLLSTPSVTTLDNEAATIVVGQNVPFRPGGYATDGNTAQPFTTIERRDVGITMNVLPRITAGGVVQLVIEQEISSLVNGTVEGAADLVTNRRVINTTVLADDGGTVVLGGLITDDRLNSTAQVPGLGDIPILGNLFRSRNNSETTRTLFVFLRPTILRDGNDIQRAAEQRYDRLQANDTALPPASLLVEREVRQLPLEIEGLY